MKVFKVCLTRSHFFVIHKDVFVEKGEEDMRERERNGLLLITVLLTLCAIKKGIRIRFPFLLLPLLQFSFPCHQRMKVIFK